MLTVPSAELDEANIIIEQLKEKLKSCSNERERDKKRYAQQLTFMENENNDLSKKVTEWNERYYDDKKKWSTQMRTLESEYNTLKAIVDSAEPARKSVAPSENKEEWEIKFQDLERDVMIKSKEISRLVKWNQELEDKLSTLTEENRLLKCNATHHNNVHDDKRELVSSLQKAVDDANSNARRYKKQVEKLNSELKNQQLLEVTISNYKSSLQANTDTINKYKKIESRYEELCMQNKELCDMFEGILEKSPVSVSGSAPVSPAVIKESFGKMQLQIADLMQEKGLLKCKITSLESKLSQSVGEARAPFASKNEGELERLNKRLQSRIDLLQEQNVLIDSENKRLRDSMLAYDEETELIVRKMNRIQQQLQQQPSTMDITVFEKNSLAPPNIIELKNKVITGLQREIDALRKKEHAVSTDGADVSAGENQAKKRKLEGVEGGTDVDCTSSTPKDEEIKKLKSDYEDIIADLKYSESILKQELFVFQKVCGTDVIIDGNADSVGIPTTDENNQEEEEEEGASAEQGVTGALTNYFGKIANGSSIRVLHMIDNPYSDIIKLRNGTMGGGNQQQLANAGVNNPYSENYWLKSAFNSVANNIAAPSVTVASVNHNNMTVMNNTMMDTSVLMNTTVNTSGNNNPAQAGTSSSSSGRYDADVMNKRLKEIFRGKIDQFREGVYLLTGYKVDLKSINSTTSTLKCRSMYAEHPDDAILFKWDHSDGSVHLMETPFTRTISPTILNFLQSTGSIPTFLSNVTSELFEKQTMC